MCFPKFGARGRTSFLRDCCGRELGNLSISLFSVANNLDHVTRQVTVKAGGLDGEVQPSVFFNSADDAPVLAAFLSSSDFGPGVHPGAPLVKCQDYAQNHWLIYIFSHTREWVIILPRCQTSIYRIVFDARPNGLRA